MRQENEFIKLRLHSLEQALGVIDCLFDNGYSYKNYTEEESIRGKVKLDITKMFSVKERAEKMKYFVVYSLEIDNEIKDFAITTKTVDIIDVREDKIKRILDELPKYK